MAINRSRQYAAMLERKGAKCTEAEIGRLGKKYTDFISFIAAEEQTGKEGQPSKQGEELENAAKQGNREKKKKAKETDKGYQLQEKQMFNPLNRLQ